MSAHHEINEEILKAIDCMAQHIKIFHIQSVNGREADFAEPCSRCPRKDCRLDWLSEMHPVLGQSSIRISMAIQELEEVADKQFREEKIMFQEEYLLEYFRNLDFTERSIVLGTAANLYREKMLATRELGVPAYKITAEDIKSVMECTAELKGGREYRAVRKKSKRAN